MRQIDVDGEWQIPNHDFPLYLHDFEALHCLPMAYVEEGLERDGMMIIGLIISGVFGFLAGIGFLLIVQQCLQHLL